MVKRHSLMFAGPAAFWAGVIHIVGIEGLESYSTCKPQQWKGVAHGKLLLSL